MKPFFIDTGEIKECIQEQLDFFQAGDILILDRIEVLPAYRKRGLGLAVACVLLLIHLEKLTVWRLDFLIHYNSTPTRKANGMERCNLKTSPMTKGWPRKNLKLIGSNSE